MICGVTFKATKRFASAASALIEQNDAVMGRVEKTSLHGIAPTARATMHKNHGLTGWVAALFIINMMKLRSFKPAALKYSACNVGVSGVSQATTFMLNL